MEGLIFLVVIVAGAAGFVLMVRRTKRKAREVRALGSSQQTAENGADPDAPDSALSGTEERRLRFVYQDAKGNISTREVTNWTDDGAYLEGYCHQAKDVRTFRRNRIVDVLQGEHLLAPMAPRLDAGGKGGGAMEILFTGFPADDRFDLENEAESQGMTVRKTVTQKLDFVCAGPKAGPTKLSKARSQGCVILDEDDFWSLVEDGVLPG